MKLFSSSRQDLLPLLNLVIPLILAGVAQSSNFFFQTLFMAHLGQDVLAAAALASWLYATLVVIAFGTMSSINVLVAHKHGADDQYGISCVLRDGFLLAIVVAVPSFLLLWKASAIFILFGQNPSIVLLADSYLRVLAWSVLPNLIMVAFLEFIIGIGRANITLIVTVSNVVLNVLCSYVLIFGKYNLPMLGITGAAWGNILSCVIVTLVLLSYLLSQKTYRHYFQSAFNFKNKTYFWELIKVGIPVGFMFCFEVGFFLALSLFMGTLGNRWLAANQVTMQYMCSLMGVIFAIAQGITVRMSFLIGKREYEAAKRAAYWGVSISAILMIIVALIYWSVPTLLIAADFNEHNPDNTAIINAIQILLSVAALFQFFEAIRISLFGALRALKDTKFTLMASIISFWGIAIPIGFLLAKKWQFGGVGFWWGMVIGAAISAMLLNLRLRSRTALLT